MPVGYLFLIVGFVLARQVAVGRVGEIPGDAKELALAFLSNDMVTVKEVLSRRGENVPVGELGSAPTGTHPDNAILNEAMRLGNAAQGYRLGATGPDYYDCSGLVWRAMKNLGMYDGARFVTATFATVANRQGWKQVSSPAAGNIILWPGKHMGISTGGDGMYSARSVAKGIGESTVSGDSGYFGSSPMFYATQAGPGITENDASPSGGGGSW